MSFSLEILGLLTERALELAGGSVGGRSPFLWESLDDCSLGVWLAGTCDMGVTLVRISTSFSLVKRSSYFVGFFMKAIPVKAKQQNKD